MQRFAQHGRSLGLTHRNTGRERATESFTPRLRSNIARLRKAYEYIGTQANAGYDISPAAEWLLENFHLLEAQFKEVVEGMPPQYFRTLPVIVESPLAGLPRVYAVVWAFVAHTDGAFNDELLLHFLNAYQENCPLNLNELWALPTTLRVVLMENMRRLAERVATNKAARELANICSDTIQTLSTAVLLQLGRVQPTRQNSAIDRKLLWPLGISGDRPVLLVSAGVTQGMGLLRSLGQCMRSWAWAQVGVDAVIVNNEPNSYLMQLQAEIAAMLEKVNRDCATEVNTTRLHLFRADELAAGTLETLHALARVHLHADGRPLAFHVRAWADEHEAALLERQAIPLQRVGTGTGAVQPPPQPCRCWAL